MIGGRSSWQAKPVWRTVLVSAVGQVLRAATAACEHVTIQQDIAYLAIITQFANTCRCGTDIRTLSSTRDVAVDPSEQLSKGEDPSCARDHPGQGTVCLKQRRGIRVKTWGPNPMTGIVEQRRWEYGYPQGLRVNLGAGTLS